MHLPYVGVAYVINEMNTSNGVVEHLTSKLNERTTCGFVHGCIAVILSKQFQWKVQALYTKHMVLLIINIIARSYAQYQFTNILTFFESCDSASGIISGRAAEGETAKDIERWSKKYLNMTDDQKAKKNAL